MLKRLIFLIGSLSIWTTGMCQVPTVQDCAGAIPVCQSLYLQPNSFSGTGNYPNEISNALSCLGGEINSVWYTFTVQTPGTLCFSITPNNAFDDYDWALYNLTNASCADIATNGALEVSCNFDPGGGAGGVTGATGNSGLGQEPCLIVAPGQTYVLNISNFSASQFGYSLLFSGSAVIFDNIAPRLRQVDPITTCGVTSLSFSFTENITCSTFTPADIQLLDPGITPIPVTSVSGPVCVSGGTQEKEFTVNFSAPITQNGTYTLRLGNAAGGVTDLCGNVSPRDSILFTLNFPVPVAGIGNTLSICSTNAPFSMRSQLTGSPSASGTWVSLGTGLPVPDQFVPGTTPSGVYRYFVGNAPCPVDSADLAILVFDPPNAGTSSTIQVCATDAPFGLITRLGGTPETGGFWTDPSGNPFGGAFTPGVDVGGLYTYTIGGQGGCPDATSTVLVQVSSGPQYTLSLSQPLCAGDANGIITIVPAVPGSITTQLLPFPAGAATSFPNLGAGQYTLVLTDAGGCRDTTTATLTNPAPLQVQINGFAHPGCSSPGSISGSASGGTGALSFFLNGAGPLPSGQFSNLGAGNYTVAVQDANGCRDSVSQTLVSQNNLILSVSNFTQPTCNGLGNGSVTLSVSGGSAPFGFSLDGVNFFPANTFTGIPGGPITFFAADGGGCLGSVNFVMPEPAPLAGFGQTILGAPCTGTTGGIVQVNVSGGTGPYQYSTDSANFLITNVFTNLNAGIYTYYVRDANQCALTIQDTMTSASGLFLQVLNGQNPGCNGLTNGTITVQANGGAGGYQYRILPGPFSASPIFSNLGAGTYTLQVRDAANCIVSLFYTLTPPPPLLLTLQALNPVTCAGAGNGSFNLLAQSPFPPFSFSIDNGVTFQPAGNFAALTGGTYPVIVMDAGSCRDTFPVFVPEPAPLNLFASQTNNVTCFGGINGSVRLEGTGGTPAYQFSVNGSPFSNSFFFPGLAAGPIVAVVQDGNFCTDTLLLNLTQPPAISGTVVAQTDVSCAGNSDGTATFRATGGTGAYSFIVNGVLIADSVATGLSTGSYQVVAVDQAGCTDTFSFFMSSPLPVSLTAAQVNDVRCFGETNGSISLAVVGGSGGYLFGLVNQPLAASPVLPSLAPGNYIAVVADVNGCTDSLGFSIQEPALLELFPPAVTDPLCANTATGLVTLLSSGGNGGNTWQLLPGTPVVSPAFLNLPAGIYRFAVIDSLGCTDSVTVTLTDPPTLGVAIDSVTNISCFGNSTGEIFLSGNGGVGNYQYALGNGVFQPAPFFELLAADTFIVRIRDGNGCDAQDTAVLTQNPRLFVFPAELLPIRCAGDANGRLVAGGSGGTGLLTFSLNNSPFSTDSLFEPLGPGNYALIIQDSLGCLEDFVFSLTDPDSLELSLQTLDVVCFGENNGRIVASTTGGTRPFTFSLNGAPFQVGGIYPNLGPGTYQVTVQDSNGCTATLPPVAINEPALLELSLQSDNPDCFNGRDGSILALGTGGLGAYRFSFNGSAFTSAGLRTGLTAGPYVVVLTDDNNCRDTVSLSLVQPERIEIVADSVKDAFCSLNNGFASVAVAGGTGLLAVRWNTQPPVEGLQVGSLFPGTYTARVTDANGCVDSLRVTVNDDPAAVAAFVTDPPADEPIPLSQASITFINQTVGGISYFWSFGDGFGFSENPNPVYEFAEPGEYTVVLTAFNRFQNCPDEDSVTLVIIPDGQIFIPNTFTPNGDGNNDFFRTFSEGMSEFELIIFDRWGKEVWQTNDPDAGWDGRSRNGMYAPEGVYAFLVRGVFAGGESIERGGTITLVR